MAEVRCASVLFMCILYSVTSFNLEPRIPVIKFGEPGSYFGFSVAEHLTINGDGSNISWLLVGAPLGQNLQPNTTRSGALWKCSVSSTPTDCIQIITDGKRTKYGKIDTNLDSDHLTAPYSDEIKEGQWLGVSVRSQGPGKKAAVCAHRYIRKQGELQFGQGLCYTLSNELELVDVMEPCRGRSVVREHEEYGFCQVGTSSSLLDDDTLLMGSPGPYTWRGTIFAQDTRDDVLERDNVVYMAPVQDGASPVEKYSYLGMSVSSGNFFGGDKASYVAGAPRAHGTGQVVIFSKLATEDWGRTDLNILNLTLLLKGEQFGSNFGYEVASADVNGDGLPDLLVGAPFYFSRDVGGAVYLYLNVNSSLHQEYNVKLTGKQESQFGIAIANAGDLNKDGCQDIAIGSPYEGNGVVYIYMGDREKGLNTKPDQVIAAESLPVLMRTFGYALSGGVDLDANGYPDLLVGAYENSSVALIRTRPIIDIKTSIRPSNTIINIDPTIHGCDRDPSSNYTCFHFQACCIIESLVKSSQSTTHRLNYVIEAETFPGGRKYSRVFFDSDKSNIVNRTIMLGRDVEDCREHIVYLKNNTRDIQTPIKFQLTYMLVHAEPRYSPSGTLPDVDQYPVLNATASSMFTANFLNDCGTDAICISDLVVDPKLLLPLTKDNKSYALTLGQEEEIKLSISVDNYGESAYETQLFVTHPPSLHYIAVNISDKHVICTSFNKTTVTCMLENPFKKQADGSPPITMRFDARALEDNDQSVIFTVWANSTSKELHPGKRPVEVEALVIKNAELLIKGVARPEQVFYGGGIKGESAMTYFDDIGTRVVHTYQVFNEGPWHVSSVQVVIQWPHQLASDTAQGKWLLYPEDVPTVDGEADQNGECFAREINPLNLTTRPGAPEPLENLEINPFLTTGKLSVSSNEKTHNETRRKYVEYSSSSSYTSSNKVRRKRDEDAVKAEAYTDRKHVINLNCQQKTAKCIQFQCVIYKLGRMKTSTISVRARLWNVTLVEEFARAARVNIASTAYISIPAHFNIHQNKQSDDRTTVETVAYPDLKISEPTEVPLWVIIISVIVGLIVLVLLIIALWKLGFFKRSRPDPTLSGNLEKNNHEASPFIGRDRNSVR
ncbi:integrin alpha-PS1 isoform X1 [Spodoptera frugiperda]|uniref:Integrin alpha-PS1 isoform X1 n=1 Tax=Spodoptera frugiperda TaxID=7108 RepID=A0A9R0D4A8_SPOFR|nr:integrin alpha-PS1 isoform X1 [Spodoptera frugiperda]